VSLSADLASGTANWRRRAQIRWVLGATGIYAIDASVSIDRDADRTRRADEADTELA
jgi:hypothetical protein